ncbi:unnamed protein product [Blepharisma stoltei]|uniref:Uncharacterized protein n=1 Tax=Blepharisma stoltei TaxID=1481888 RepID=A0AAU9JL16_9CILI|nr:unnamed protein product [Blepharisma stoltei]
MIANLFDFISISYILDFSLLLGLTSHKDWFTWRELWDIRSRMATFVFAMLYLTIIAITLASGKSLGLDNGNFEVSTIFCVLG